MVQTMGRRKSTRIIMTAMIGYELKNISFNHPPEANHKD
jgi:hypothetical protein